MNQKEYVVYCVQEKLKALKSAKELFETEISIEQDLKLRVIIRELKAQLKI